MQNKQTNTKGIKVMEKTQIELQRALDVLSGSRGALANARQQAIEANNSFAARAIAEAEKQAVKLDGNIRQLIVDCDC